MKHKRVYVSFLVLLSLFIALTAGAQDIIDIPESSLLRGRIEEPWFDLPVPVLKTTEAEVIQSMDGTYFQVSVEDYGDQCAIVVAPGKVEKVENYSASGVEVTERTMYLSESPGSWILFKDSKTGEPICIRYYFAVNTEVFLQFRRSSTVPSEKSLADVMVFGEYAAKDIPIGIPLEYFYDMSIDDVLSLIKLVVPWATSSFYSSLYSDTLQMIAKIREKLPRFRLQDEVAYDEMGNLVSIKTGNSVYIPGGYENTLFVSSAGFVKWIVDGLVRPISGSGILLDPLVESTEELKTGSVAETKSKEYDTMLALDWTRNLATAMVSIYSGRDYEYGTSGVQVNSAPFNGAYIETAGFKISMLKPIFYYLAVTEPGRFYLGAIRHMANDGAEFVVYNKCAAFFPAFDRNGKFSVAAFIDGEEMKIEDFMKDYGSDFIQLVRIQSSEQSFPR